MNFSSSNSVAFNVAQRALKAYLKAHSSDPNENNESQQLKQTSYFSRATTLLTFLNLSLFGYLLVSRLIDCARKRFLFSLYRRIYRRRFLNQSSSNFDGLQSWEKSLEEEDGNLNSPCPRHDPTELANSYASLCARARLELNSSPIDARQFWQLKNFRSKKMF